MKIEMDYEEFKLLEKKLKDTEDELQYWKKAVSTVYGAEICNGLLRKASEIQKERDRFEIIRRVQEGKF